MGKSVSALLLTLRHLEKVKLIITIPQLIDFWKFEIKKWLESSGIE